MTPRIKMLLFQLYFALGGSFWIMPLALPDPRQFLLWIFTIPAVLIFLVVAVPGGDGLDALIPSWGYAIGLAGTGGALMFFVYHAWPVALLEGSLVLAALNVVSQALLDLRQVPRCILEAPEA